MPKIQVFAGHSIDHRDERDASVTDHGYVNAPNLPEELRHIGLNYKQADYFGTRQVVIVIDPMIPSHDEKDMEIARLRSALIASGVKEGLVDAIQQGAS